MSIIISTVISFLFWKLCPGMIDFGSFSNLVLTLLIVYTCDIIATLLTIGGFSIFIKKYLSKGSMPIFAISTVVIAIMAAVVTTFLGLSIAEKIFDTVNFSMTGKIALSFVLAIISSKHNSATAS